MRFFIGLLTFVLSAYHVRIRRFPTGRQIGAYFLAVNGVAAFGAGFYLSMKEDASARYGEVAEGAVVERISSTGESGTRTMGLSGALRRQDRYDPLRSINTLEGSQFYEILTRQLLTRTTEMWVIDYEYDCRRSRRCSGRDFVPHERWLQLHDGARVDVTYVRDGIGGERLEDNPQWGTAFAEMALGACLALGAAAMFGALPSLARRTHRLETMAVVNRVERVECIGEPRWRVTFSYLDDLGHPREATDEFATDSWKVGKCGRAVYEVADPDRAGLRPAQPAKER